MIWQHSHKIFGVADCRRALLDLWRSIFGRTVRTKGWANNTSQDWMRSKARMPWSWSQFMVMVNFMVRVTVYGDGQFHAHKSHSCRCRGDALAQLVNCWCQNTTAQFDGSCLDLVILLISALWAWILITKQAHKARLRQQLNKCLKCRKSKMELKGDLNLATGFARK